jgi:hypothetical protein
LPAPTAPNARVLARLAKVDVLVLDDWAMAPITDAERRDLHEVLDDRYGPSTIIITSQVPHKRWHEHLGDPAHADAICDRLIHNAHRLNLKGPSRGRPEDGTTPRQVPATVRVASLRSPSTDPGDRDAPVSVITMAVPRAFTALGKLWTAAKQHSRPTVSSWRWAEW